MLCFFWLQDNGNAWAGQWPRLIPAQGAPLRSPGIVLWAQGPTAVGHQAPSLTAPHEWDLPDIQKLPGVTLALSLLPLLLTHTSVPLGEGLILVSRLGEKTFFNFND